MKKSITIFGSPMVEFIVKIQDEFLHKFNLPKGIAIIWPPEKVLPILKEVEINCIVPGGSGANIARGIAFLGGSAKLLGKYSNDQFGQAFAQTLQEYGVIDCCTVESGLITTNILSLVTPDGERTMLPLYGASHTITPNDINYNTIQTSDYFLVDGYQFANENLIQTSYSIIDYAANNNVEIALSLSNIACITNYFNHIKYVADKACIILGNYVEFIELFKTKDLEQTIQYLQPLCKDQYSVLVITMDEKGALAITKDRVYYFQPKNTTNIIDLTGAGDFFAAGFMYGYLQGHNIQTCGEIASILAADVISQSGSNISKQLQDKIAPFLKSIC